MPSQEMTRAMCDAVRYEMHFNYPDRGEGQVSGPIGYSPNGAEMDFEKVQGYMDAVFGRDNYHITRLVMQPWYKNFVILFRLTDEYIQTRLPIDIKVSDFCKRAVETFAREFGGEAHG